MLESPPIRCAHTRLVPLTELGPHPRNPNVHPPEQIRILAKIITHQGWRSPITVSTRSGLVVTGHGRLAAAQLLGLESAPCDFQDFATDEDELAHLFADNAIADMAEIDPTMAKEIAEALSAAPDFDAELVGLTNEDFRLVMNPAPESEPGVNDPNAHWQGMPEFNQPEVFDTALVCIVRFKTEASRSAFEKFLGWSLSHKGKIFSTWYPKSEHDQLHAGMAFQAE